jgi:hypothetical protein
MIIFYRGWTKISEQWVIDFGNEFDPFFVALLDQRKEFICTQHVNKITQTWTLNEFDKKMENQRMN